MPYSYDYISTDNSTTTALAGGASFTGEWEDCSKWATLVVSVSTDAPGTLYVEFSLTKDRVDYTKRLSDILELDHASHVVTPQARYFRVRFANGTGAQGRLGIQTLFTHYPRTPSSIEAAGDDENDALRVTLVARDGDAAKPTRSETRVEEELAEIKALLETLVVHAKLVTGLEVEDHEH